ncbi:beta-carotene 15,15'-monooxygenase [Ureibacillus chungkukjangi]|uniref:Beta-carotene 15,15'-monooxygenase n=1 Tax=Ureibacillus chungkukjangi TaxID=1202712 RepID=A0A318TDW1_9BACL|nr:beta-carotene 15,15'-monooxygenase [Ureibacillus chungkukjangi]PYF03051.1 hypothetical protein BJ095_1347 [Ureibacillus chungkukjangi]
MAILQKSKQTILMLLLLLVLGSNIILYRTDFGQFALTGESKGVVIGSLIDLVIVAPLLFLTYKKKKSIKQFVLLMAGGLILARFVIPMSYLEPFIALTWIGFAVEAGLLLIEILLVVTLFKFLPRIVKYTKESELPKVFAFSDATDKYVKKHPLIHIICSEMLMFYYAFCSWKKKPLETNHSLTIHKKSSYISFQIMLIHAIIIETIGIHWWLHEKYMILSLILLLINLYSVIFLLADIQAVRLNPIHMDERKLYISLGLVKRIEVKWNEIEEVITDKDILKQKLSKDTIEFVAKDFDKVLPDFILQLKKPMEATLIMGIKKPYQKIAIKLDDYKAFSEVLKKHNF